MSSGINYSLPFWTRVVLACGIVIGRPIKLPGHPPRK
jgi:hypothetical protein